MAQNQKSTGQNIDAPFIIATNTTITAGSMIFSDLSGTNVVRAISTATESTAFVGVIVNTQTGTATGGRQTGVTISTEGVFEFVTETLATGSPVELGRPVWAIAHDTVRGVGTGTATTITGQYPVGICVFLPQGIDDTATSVRVWVKIFPFKQITHIDYLLDATLTTAPANQVG